MLLHDALNNNSKAGKIIIFVDAVSPPLVCLAAAGVDLNLDIVTFFFN